MTLFLEFTLCEYSFSLRKNVNINKLTSKDLESSSEEEAPSLLQSEELAEEQEEGQAAEDDGQDHEGLDRLDPLCRDEQINRTRPSITIMIHIIIT